MKRICSILLVLSLLLLVGCSSGAPEATRLSFAESTSIERISSLDGKTVTINGYMATLSPLDGRYIYLMNMPYQSCPFCIPNTQQLSNTMAVYAKRGSRFDFTDRPVRVTGTLRMGQMADDYGYTYSYYIEDAVCEVIDLSALSQEFALYQALAEEGVIADIYSSFDYLCFLCQWTDYTSSYTDATGAEVTYFLYPGDVEMVLDEEPPFGFKTQAAPDYYPSLIRRVQAVSPDGLSELVQVLVDAQALALYAAQQLSDGAYTYIESQDQYLLNQSEALYARYSDLYLRFDNWLSRCEL